jgi:DNA ligase-1
MKRFAQLFARLDESTSTEAKVETMARYFGAADPRDAAWAVYFLAGGKPRQVVRTRELRAFALAASGLPEWLFEESYQAVGDLAETIALLLPPPRGETALSLADWIETRLLPLRGRAPEDVLAALRGYADELNAAERFLLVKLIGGGFRVGVSRLLVTRALARVAGVDARLIAQRLVGATDDAARPSADGFRALLAPAAEGVSARGGTPYPFFLAHSLAREVESLGGAGDWLAEWKYDGIRAQLVHRDGETWLWSRGEELITERFPEIAQAAVAFPAGTVLDGEVLVWDATAGRPAAFARLQTRITRKSATARVQREHPACFIAYDLLEHGGEDWRERPQRERREALEALLRDVPAAGALRLSPLVEGESWARLAALRAESRARGVEGLMLKQAQSRYGVGRTRDVGTWWKWKIEPMSVDAVLVYAQRGHGRRASLYTDYTFAVWERAPRDAGEAAAVVEAIAAGEKAEASAARGLPRLVPFAKAYSGLSDQEIREVDAVIRRTTVESFGPVRSVAPSLVFELGFEGIQQSPRHRSGIAVRFPRMLRIRHDKPLHEADTLDSLRALLDATAGRRDAALVPPPSAGDESR